MRRPASIITMMCATAILLVLVGYMLAVLSFRQEVWIDYHSGARKTTCTLFPFSLATDHSRDAFWVLFGTHSDDDDESADWQRLESQRFIELNALLMERRWIHTEAQDFAGAESRLIAHLMHQDTARRERDKLSNGFYTALHRGGVSAAMRYVDKLIAKDLDRSEGQGDD